MQPENLSNGHDTVQPKVQPEARLSRLIRLPEVMKRVGLSRSAVYKRMADGRFPKSRSLGPKCAVWIEAEIEKWISDVQDQIG